MWLSFTPPGITLDRCRLTKSGEQIVAADIVPAEIAPCTPSRIRSYVELTWPFSDHHKPRCAGRAIGTRSPLNFARTQPDPEGGLHFSLFNNAWGTNYPQWANGDWLYSFEVTV